jgi:hypothetical protein
MGDRGRKYAQSRHAVDPRKRRLRLAQRFRGEHVLTVIVLDVDVAVPHNSAVPFRWLAGGMETASLAAALTGETHRDQFNRLQRERPRAHRANTEVRRVRGTAARRGGA